ncbi:M64 family metallopeptidase [Flavobacterium silvaticum]|uniref:Uncharacterized protein n=1 Tax=Flavobacterium silvaticum TaxID=1852020 RepID=A0A972JHJ1_9FLAO|nr:M64 family metallopeptidase [Flavobacterium silvaticum]NMH27990.1 hypothetical protein [Flavobacterium silvaticum]
MDIPRSIRLHFDNSDRKNLKLIDGTAALTIPPGSASLESRAGMTGFWVELSDSNGTLLYRIDTPGLIIPQSEDLINPEAESFDLLIPYMSQATNLAFFAPPRHPDNLEIQFGEESVLIKTFTIPSLPELIQFQPSVILPSDITGEGRGQVLSVATLLHHGPAKYVYNLVILAEKFSGSEQSDFLKAASECISFLQSKPPFTGVFGADAMNIYVLEIETTDNALPYFHTEYASEGTTTTWNHVCVTTVCDALFNSKGKPFWNWACILVNETEKRIGTQLGNQFATGLKEGSSGIDHEQTFQHEFGHCAFGLGDEYTQSPFGSYTGDEPAYPNLTKETSADKIKWKKLLTPGIDIPTMKNVPGCDSKNEDSNPTNDDASVGSYAGGKSFSCDIYHPQYLCVMNEATKADGLYCEVCLHEANKVLARAAPLLAPAPGSIFYSPISGTWNNAQVAANVIDYFGMLSDYPNFDETILELRSGTAGPYVFDIFSVLKKTIPPDVEVFQLEYDDSASEGIWYLLSKSLQVTFYVHSFKLSTYNELSLGQIALPSFPIMSLFDGVVVGTIINLFAEYNGMLAYGTLGTDGNIVNGELTNQYVKGLANTVTDLSVDLSSPIIWVGVIDRFLVKISGYQLQSESWFDAGFVQMPVPTGNDFIKIRIVTIDHLVHVICQSDDGLYYNTFNTISYSWSGIAIRAVSGQPTYFDVSSDGKKLYLIVNESASVTLYSKTIGSGSWDSKDITATLELEPADAVSSLGAAVLHGNLYIVMLINEYPEYAIYNIAQGNCVPFLTEIKPLESLASKTGAMMVHATSNQIYVGLSEAKGSS